MMDFLIIGGGIAGVSAAARLSHLGSVLLLESEDVLATQASGRSAALFEENYGSPSTLELNRASREHHENAFGGVLSPRGFMLVGPTDAVDQTAREAEKMRLTPMDVAQALETVPILDGTSVGYAAYDADSWDIDTDRLIQGFARDARSRGARIGTRAQVTGITRTDTGWSVSAGIDQFEARNLINAAGAWVDEIAKLAGIAPIGFQPNRRSMARLPAPGGHDVSGWPMVFGAGESWYAKPDAGALLVSPSEEHPMHAHDAWADDMVIAEGLARYEAFVTEPVTRVLTTWAGLRTFSPDRSLVIGPDPIAPDFWWLAGQGGYGMQSSPAASELLGELAGGKQTTLPSEVCAALAPDRFR